MSKRKTGWKESYRARGKRKEPIYNPDMVAKIKAAQSGPTREVCCEKFPDCDCPDPADDIPELV